MTRTDDNWALAQSIQLTPSLEGLKPGRKGVVMAAAHPTGWFVSARFDPDLAPEDIADFAHFVHVRTYLLLAQGPAVGSWEPGPDGVWRAHYTAPIADVSADLSISA